MIIFIFGNPDLDFDSLPIKLLPRLQQDFPKIEFKALDPNEEWNLPEMAVILDTVVGLKRVTVIDDLTKIKNSPHLTMHDFDAGSNLKYLQKLGKIKQAVVIGIPTDYSPEQALTEIKPIIASLL